MMSPPPDHVLWDDDKAESNEREHGVTFNAAESVFDDPLAATFHDGTHSDDEDRWLTIGHSRDSALVVVIYTCNVRNDGGSNIRIISARKATLWERRGYETGQYSIREPAPHLEYGVMKDPLADELPRDFDFSKGVIGKFYREGALRCYPVYLDPEVLKYFSERAFEQDTEIQPFLNDLLRREIERIAGGK